MNDNAVAALSARSHGPLLAASRNTPLSLSGVKTDLL